MTAQLCTGFGQYDTHSITLSSGKPNTSPNAGKPYGGVTEAEIAAMVENPPSVHKDDAQWIIPSDYCGPDGREHDAQQQHGQFWTLPLDLDENNPPLRAVDVALVGVLGDVARSIYSSRSATREAFKWRAIGWLDAPIAGEDYADTIEAFNDLIEEASDGVLIPDRALQRTGQLVFLPNRGEHYEHETHTGPKIHLTPDHHVIKRREETRRKRADAEAAARARKEWKARQAPSGNADVVGAFNAEHTVAEMLERCGYKRAKSSDNWRSPMQSGGSYATRDYGDHWISLSASDGVAGVGEDTKTGHRFGDAFDLFVHFEHAGNFNAAVRARAGTRERDLLEQFASGPGDYRPPGAMDAPVVQPNAVDEMIERIRPNPHTAVTLLAGEIARMAPNDRDMVLARCKDFTIKMEMKAAVKRALAEYTVAQGAKRVAAAAGPLSHYYIVQNDNGQAVAVDSRGDMPPQARRALIDALAGLEAIPVPSGDSVKMVSAVDHWWTDPETTRYAALGYDPNAGVVYLDRKEREIRNVYEPGCDGPPMPTGEATVGPFMHLIHSNFPDPSDRQMLLQALAFMAHRPGQMLRWAPVMQGTQGCGKGLIARAVSYAVGRHNTSHPSPDIIATDFNSYMYRKVLVIVDEIGDHTKRELSALAEKLKPWITDDALHVHQKSKDGFDTPNFTSWILTTNHKDKMLATPGERRYAHFISALQTEASLAVAYPSDWWSGSASYAMLEPGHDWFSYYEHWWTKCGGAEATRGFLSTVDLSDVPVRAPKTSSTEEAIRESASETQNALAEAVADKARGFRGGFISSNAIRDLLRSDGIMQPHSMHLSRALASLGFVHSVRVTTSSAEKLAFADASTKTRIYYTAASDGLEPHVVSARHDQTLETKPPPVPAGITRLV